MKIAEEVRETLKEYRETFPGRGICKLLKKRTEEALIRQDQLAALDAPKKRALDVVRTQSNDYLYDDHRNVKQPRPLLGGLAERRLLQHNNQDLASIRRPADNDLLSRFLQEHWMFKVPTIYYFPSYGILTTKD